jgi:aryl-alcohol dehydrogenase-like predicted oxidoreductase
MQTESSGEVCSTESFRWTTHLGRTGLKVSRLALGTMNFGELTDEATSFSIMDEALDAGINLFDTADIYGGPQSPDMERGFGTSEEIIGR